MEVLGILGGTIEMSRGVTTKYTTFMTFPKQATEFRSLLVVVQDVLENLQSNLLHHHQQQQGWGATITSKLNRPLDLLMDAIKKGEDVLNKCSQPNNLGTRMFADSYMNKIRSAKSDINMALRLISTTTSSMIMVRQEDTNSLTNNIQKVHAQLDRVEDMLLQQTSDVTELITTLIQPTLDALPDTIINKLIEKKIVANKKEFYEEVRDIQQDEQLVTSLRNEKAFMEDHILDWVLKLSSSEQDSQSNSSGDEDIVADVNAEPPSNRSNGDDNRGNQKLVPITKIPRRNDTLLVQGHLRCPISLEIMEDPVLLLVPDPKQPPHVYDKQSIYSSLLTYNPTMEPVTGEVYDTKLSYVDSITTRQLLMSMYGDDAYKKFDDANFQSMYDRAWDQYWSTKRSNSNGGLFRGSRSDNTADGDPILVESINNNISTNYAESQNRVHNSSDRPYQSRREGAERGYQSFVTTAASAHSPPQYTTTRRNNNGIDQARFASSFYAESSSSPPLTLLYSASNGSSTTSMSDSNGSSSLLLDSDEGGITSNGDEGRVTRDEIYNALLSTSTDEKAIIAWCTRMDEFLYGMDLRKVDYKAAYQLAKNGGNGGTSLSTMEQKHPIVLAYRAYVLSWWHEQSLVVDTSEFYDDKDDATVLWNLAITNGLHELAAAHEQDLSSPTKALIIKEAAFLVGKYYLSLSSQIGDDYSLSNNEKNAFGWCQKAGKLGHVHSQCILGDTYCGRGQLRAFVAQDVSKAIKWYELAAKQGHAIAQYCLGCMSSRHKMAFHWLKKSAMQGFAPAQYKLGLRKERDSRGSLTGLLEAVSWYKMASEQDYDPANKKLRELMMEEEEEEAHTPFS